MRKTELDIFAAFIPFIDPALTAGLEHVSGQNIEREEIFALPKQKLLSL
jgi:hypothetical protein